MGSGVAQVSFQADRRPEKLSAVVIDSQCGKDSL